ncbi:MAG: hypothetical protein HC910_11365 [Spirulinaceae cyanobacterium SM2_1_0]|nr:hypothetical protein [Spirulinaceae cyanobacterium SM2_1_0]
MSFIHLDKSIVSLHFKEILEDGSPMGTVALFSLGALLLAPKLAATLSVAPKSVAAVSAQPRSPYRPQMSLSAWVARQQQQRAAMAAPSRYASLRMQPCPNDSIAA